ncbi:MAG: hypothetical protein UHP25_09300, partial [Prevotella sp.]|nr:hypothetical protein [Prevotella sp.]
LKLKNVFVKPNEQNKARFNSVMARKGAIKWKLSLPTVVREVKRLELKNIKKHYKSVQKLCLS